MKNYYFILGLNIYANESEIKHAYRKLALQFHPDKNPSPEAESIFKEINEAYEILGDPNSKYSYDQLLRGVSPAAPTSTRQHRDPGYRPRPPGSYPRTSKRQELLMVMSQYLPHARFISMFAFLFSIILLTDYSLPKSKSEKEVMGTRFRREVRGNQSVELQFEGGGELNVNKQVAREFTAGSKLIISYSSIFNVPVVIENSLTHYKTNVAVSIYGNFIFIPLILLITSLLGTFYWKGIEFRFNLGIVNLLMLLLTLIFLRIHTL
jgi:curved DNA-binding protein CbpA